MGNPIPLLATSLLEDSSLGALCEQGLTRASAQECPGTCLCGTSKGKAEKRIPVCCSEYKSVTGALQRQFG